MLRRDGRHAAKQPRCLLLSGGQVRNQVRNPALAGPAHCEFDQNSQPANQMKHWANTYVFDHSSIPSRQSGSSDLRSSDVQQPPQHPSAAAAAAAASAAAESHHESSHQNNSAHWSSIVDPYSEHGPAISIHDRNLYAFPTTIYAPNNDANGDPIRHPPELSRLENEKAASASPCMPQQMPLAEPNNDEKVIHDGKPSAGPRDWYGQQKESDWYGVTVRTANKTPLHVLGYQSEDDEDGCGDQGPVINNEKSLISFVEKCTSNQASDIATSIVGNNPNCNAASCHTTIASEYDKQSSCRNDDSDSSDSNVEREDTNHGSSDNGDICFDCFFGLSWLRFIFQHNNGIHTKQNNIQ